LGLYLDLQKASDTFNHSILLWKLNNYGITGILHSWFTDYFHNRKQFTSINGYSSSKLSVSCGIRKGSVLGPLLFLVYVNDLPHSVPGGKIKIFADDTNFFTSASTINEFEQTASCHCTFSIYHCTLCVSLHFKNALLQSFSSTI